MRARSIVGLCLMMMVSLGACTADEPSADLLVKNESDVQVYVSWTTGDEERVDSLGPGVGPGFERAMLFEDGGGEGDCPEMDAVAAVESGEIVDRLEAPICFGDTWTVDG